MKKFISLATISAILSLTACQKEEFENQVTPANNPNSISNLSNPEEAFPGEVGVKEKGYLFGQPIEYLRINGKAVFQGDIILTEEQLSGTQTPSESKNGRTEGAGRTLQASRWPNNTVYYVIDPSLPNQQRVRDAIAHWQTRTFIKFVPRATQPNYINFRPGGSCWSHIGMTGQGQQDIEVGGGCSTGSVIHEIGHALGLWHEQSRSDRDNFIKVNYSNIIPGTEGNFNKYHEGFDHASFDFGSIMLYSSYDFSRNGLPTITRLDGSTFSANRTALSCGDIAIIHEMYPNPSGIFSANQNWTATPYYGTRGTFFADVTGDKKADAIVVNDYGIHVINSNGNAFPGNPVPWTPFSSWPMNNIYYGTKGTFFADVTGDKKADAIAVNNNGVTVCASYGSGFSSKVSWTTNAYYGSRGTFFADVTGDGKADAIVVNDYGVTVRRSTGSGFSANETWTTNAYYGSRGTFFADVTGDGKADAIAVNNNGIAVRRSTGNGFSATNEPWTSGVAYYGTRGTFFADVTGDRKADAIVVNDYGVTVRTSTGKLFLGNAPGTTNAYYGDRGTFFADVSGDGFADAIVVNNNLGVVVRPRLLTFINGCWIH